MKLVALVATLFALILPASGLAAGADVTPNRSCSYLGYEGVGVTVFNASGYTVSCRVRIPGTHGMTVIVYTNHSGV